MVFKKSISHPRRILICVTYKNVMFISISRNVSAFMLSLVISIYLVLVLISRIRFLCGIHNGLSDVAGLAFVFLFRYTILSTKSWKCLTLCRLSAGLRLDTSLWRRTRVRLWTLTLGLAGMWGDREEMSSISWISMTFTWRGDSTCWGGWNKMSQVIICSLSTKQTHIF